ncbi:MAG: MMPL family transporter [Verrucomicrobia bacterium]|nr:MMPL family transporter [Verrucomicrobiota bacterium]
MSFPVKKLWWLFLLVPLLLGLARLRFDADVLDLLPGDLPAVQGLKLYQQHFANARELIITLRAADGEEAGRFAGALAGRLRAETNLVASVSWQPPWMEQPAQAAEIVAYLWLNQPPDAFGALTNRLAPDHLGSVLADTRDALATSLSPMDLARRPFDPYDLLSVPSLASVSGPAAQQGDRMFASADGTFRALFVKGRSDLGGYRECSEFLKSVRDTVETTRARQESWRNVVVRYTGRPAFVTEIAANMQRDLSGSVVGTAAIIALLFWLTHRRWLPMLWLLTLLGFVLAATLALGGLVLGTISVISMGFAAVLLGLAVDYAVIHYQEALAHPHLSVPEIRRVIAPSILWAAITTITAFLVLNLGGLPGLAQLGSLVAIGVALAAVVMVMVYLPPLFPNRRKAPEHLPRPSWWSFFIPQKDSVAAPAAATDRVYQRYAFAATALIIALAAVVLVFRRPGLDKSANALRPQQAAAQAALEEVTASLGLPQDSLWIVVPGNDERVVQDHLTKSEALLKLAQSNQAISSYRLPSALWPHVEFQEANRATARWLGQQAPQLREAAIRAGFKPEVMFLTDELIRCWAVAGASTGVFWPTNNMSRWLLERFVARTTNEWFVMGVVTPPTNHRGVAPVAELSTALAKHGVLLSGWELLGATTLQRVRERLWLVVAPMVFLVLLSLWLAFRRITEVLLGVAVLLLSGLCLLAIMGLAGWSWNLLNLMALPLMLGTGVDYGIFMQLALRRHGGDLRVVRRSIGRALLLCGGTTIAGFGSLAWSGNAGMASLGKVCAVGLGANMLIAVTLLPAWWRWGTATWRPDMAATQLPKSPSSFYGVAAWQLGLALGRWLPRCICYGVALLAAEVYRLLCPRRREVVALNLQPVLLEDKLEATRMARRLFRQFAFKLVDLWRYESGVNETHWETTSEGWRILDMARQRGSGVLLVTPHLGNWELGGPLMTQHGVKLIVLTQPEPDRGLTELRRAARARWGIETIVVGDDGFAFVEIIKRLQAGETVALLLDRPPERNAAEIELFGRPFRASLAAAELARAAGCALIGVTMVRMNQSYQVEVLPEFTYDRRSLGTREARRELTQHIMRAFEPKIRKHADQWFHFVAVFSKSDRAPEMICREETAA